MEWLVRLANSITLEPVCSTIFGLGNGGVTYAKGVVQQVSPQENRASYQNDVVPQHVQEIAAKRDIAEGLGKQVTGATQMVNATADVVSTDVPVGAEAALSVKASNLGKWVKAPKAVSSMPKPPAFSNWGMETLDDAIRTTEQLYSRPKVGLPLNNSVSEVVGKSYKALGEVTVPIKNIEILNALESTSKGNWVKVYEAGIQDGQKIEMHYFRNNSTNQVFDVKPKYNYWHQKQFKSIKE